MQTISNRYSMPKRQAVVKPSDRYDIRTEIARLVTRNMTQLNRDVCEQIIRTANSEFGRKKEE